MSFKSLYEVTGNVTDVNTMLVPRTFFKDVLSWVYHADRNKPYDDPDLYGEVVRIRLTGLCSLANLARPGCREKAIERFLAAIKPYRSPADLEYESWFPPLPQPTQQEPEE